LVEDLDYAARADVFRKGSEAPDVSEEDGDLPLILDSKEPTIPLEEYTYSENRFQMLRKSNPERAAMLLQAAKKDVAARFKMYQQWAEMD